jgi:hypothetical protein
VLPADLLATQLGYNKCFANGRSLFMSVDEFMGLTSRDAREGDMIVLFSGGRSTVCSTEARLWGVQIHWRLFPSWPHGWRGDRWVFSGSSRRSCAYLSRHRGNINIGSTCCRPQNDYLCARSSLGCPGIRGTRVDESQRVILRNFLTHSQILARA